MSSRINKMMFDAATQKNVDLWLTGHYDEETKSAIRRLINDNPKEIVDAFYTSLAFGTAGMRGIMGVGSNRMNQYTVRAATQGLANYLSKQPAPPQGHSVLIGYDSRHNSRMFAEESAKVLAANAIRVYIFEELRPTPLVSFGCRFKKCSAAIMVTASHNPPEYNGYKVYWSDGGQVLPPHDKGIVAEFNAITDVTQVKHVDSLKHPLINWIGKEIDEAYLKIISKLQHYPRENQQFGSNLKVVYTSLHGTGITLMPQALASWGFSNVELVAKQVIPDGDFPTSPMPNPENHKALALGIETMERIHGDLLIATDPDADRIGVAFKHQGKVHTLDGNQIASICLHHVCEALTAGKKMPERAAFIKTIGTTELFQAICDDYHKPCFNVLTGFKYIAEKIRQWEQDPKGYQYVFGGEESYGYLLGTQARDKDAILSGVLLCEVALHAKQKGKSLLDVLYDLYRKYGVHLEKLLSMEFEESKEGKEQMANGMTHLCQAPPKVIAGVPVAVMEDYQRSIKIDIKSGKTEKLTLPKSEVLLFWLDDGSKVMVRPSGTEPKIKLYCGVVNKNTRSIPDAIRESHLYADKLLAALQKTFLTRTD